MKYGYMMGDERIPALIDMINGGGAGQSGDEFEGGGLLSNIANLIATPLGSRQRAAQREQAMSAGAPPRPMQGGPQPAQNPGMTPGMSMGPFDPSMMPPQQQPQVPQMGMQGPSAVEQYATAYGLGGNPSGMSAQPTMQQTDNPLIRELQMALRMRGAI